MYGYECGLELGWYRREKVRVSALSVVVDVDTPCREEDSEVPVVKINRRTLGRGRSAEDVRAISVICQICFAPGALAKFVPDDMVLGPWHESELFVVVSAVSLLCSSTNKKKRLDSCFKSTIYAFWY